MSDLSNYSESEQGVIQDYVEHFLKKKIRYYKNRGEMLKSFAVEQLLNSFKKEIYHVENAK
jgi:hypothetical protein